MTRERLPTNPSRARCGAPVNASALAAVENPAPGSDTWLAPTPTAAAVVDRCDCRDCRVNLLLRQGGGPLRTRRTGVRTFPTCDPPTTALLIRSPTPLSRRDLVVPELSRRWCVGQCMGVTDVAATAESNDLAQEWRKVTFGFLWDTAAVSERWRASQRTNNANRCHCCRALLPHDSREVGFSDSARYPHCQPAQPNGQAAIGISAYREPDVT